MTTIKRWTIEELERDGAPEGRWELIDGELVAIPPSSMLGSATAVTIASFLLDHVHPRRLGTILGADGGLVPFPDRETVRVADVAFLRAERMPAADRARDPFPRCAPDLVVEVISPFDQSDGVAAKVAMWEEAGVPLVWLVEPRDRTVVVYARGRPPFSLRDGDALDGGDVLPDFRVPVADLFR